MGDMCLIVTGYKLDRYSWGYWTLESEFTHKVLPFLFYCGIKWKEWWVYIYYKTGIWRTKKKMENSTKTHLLFVESPSAI